MKVYVKSLSTTVPIEWYSEKDGLLKDETVSKLVPLFYSYSGNPYDYLEGDGDFDEEVQGAMEYYEENSYIDDIDSVRELKPKYRNDCAFGYCLKMSNSTFSVSADIGDYEPEFHNNLLEMYNKYF